MLTIYYKGYDEKRYENCKLFCMNGEWIRSWKSLKVIMQWTYHASKKPSADFVSDWLDAGTALVITEDLEKAGRLKEVEFKDEFDTTWTKKELKKLLTEVEEEPQDVTVFLMEVFKRMKRWQESVLPFIFVKVRSSGGCAPI